MYKNYSPKVAEKLLRQPLRLVHRPACSFSRFLARCTCTSTSKLAKLRIMTQVAGKGGGPVSCRFHAFRTQSDHTSSGFVQTPAPQNERFLFFQKCPLHGDPKLSCASVCVCVLRPRYQRNSVNFVSSFATLNLNFSPVKRSNSVQQVVVLVFSSSLQHRGPLSFFLRSWTHYQNESVAENQQKCPKSNGLGPLNLLCFGSKLTKNVLKGSSKFGQFRTSKSKMPKYKVVLCSFANDFVAKRVLVANSGACIQVRS